MHASLEFFEKKGSNGALTVDTKLLPRRVLI